jgi:hypothetical protein
MAQFLDSQIANSSHEAVLSEGVNSIPLALAYYGKTDAHLLRYKWVADQSGKQSLGELIGQGRTFGSFHPNRGGPQDCLKKTGTN